MTSHTRFYPGYTFHNMTLVEKTNIKGRNTAYKWEARCVCGRMVLLEAADIGHNKSCGCMNRHHPNYVRDRRFKMPYRYLARRHYQRWTDAVIDYEQFVALIEQNCRYCGDKPYNLLDGERYQGIDRVDNEYGYVNGNCVPCCIVCNRMKHTLAQDQFIHHISKIYHNFLGE